MRQTTLFAMSSNRFPFKDSKKKKNNNGNVKKNNDGNMKKSKNTISDKPKIDLNSLSQTMKDIMERRKAVERIKQQFMAKSIVNR
eukprot:UN00420